jgi:hypothetical protein
MEIDLIQAQQELTQSKDEMGTIEEYQVDQSRE